MNRRQLLATLGVGIGSVSGCLSESPSESTATPGSTDGQSTSPTDTPAETPEDTSEGLGPIVVRKAVTYESVMGSGGVLAADGRQYVVAAIETEAPETEYVFEASGQTWESGVPATAGAGRYAVTDLERPLVTFDIPSPLSAAGPRIRAETSGAEWTLPADAVATLESPAPRYELDGLTVPERVSQGETMSVELRATNVSETDGRFLVAVYWPTRRIADDDESHILDRTVPAGDSVTATLDIDTAYTTNESGPVTLSVEGHVDASREIHVNEDDGEQATESPPSLIRSAVASCPGRTAADIQR